jgi:phosphoribosylformylglycinamidine synthase
MAMKAEEIKKLIIKEISDALVTIIPLKDDDDHFQAEIISSCFVGKTPVQQHRLVYRALQGAMDGPLHALSIITKTP